MKFSVLMVGDSSEQLTELQPPQVLPQRPICTKVNSWYKRSIAHHPYVDWLK